VNTIQVEPRNLLFFDLPGNLSSLRVQERANGIYIDLRNPSDELARIALWEAVIRYANTWRGDYAAPPLEITATPKGM